SKRSLKSPLSADWWNVVPRSPQRSRLSGPCSPAPVAPMRAQSEAEMPKRRTVRAARCGCGRVLSVSFMPPEWQNGGLARPLLLIKDCPKSIKCQYKRRTRSADAMAVGDEGVAFVQLSYSLNSLERLDK